MPQPLRYLAAGEYALDPDSENELANLFSYHPPLSPDQTARYERVRAAGWAFARELYVLCPPSSERTLARRAIEEAVMRGNQAIAVNEYGYVSPPDVSYPGAAEEQAEREARYREDVPKN